MKVKHGVTLVLILVLILTVTPFPALSQPPPSGGEMPPSPPSEGGQLPPQPSGEGQEQGPAPPPPEATAAPPSEAPEPMQGKPAPSYTGPVEVSPEEVGAEGQLPKGAVLAIVPAGPHIYVWYNGMWVDTPAAICLGGWTDVIIWNDRDQYLWLWEGYPDGTNRWYNLGYRRGSTWIRVWFQGDVAGWHRVAVWGSRSGWSNIVYIYVAMCGWTPRPHPRPPLPGPGGGGLSINVWTDRSYYHVGDTITIYYSVNMRCFARLTISGPALYVSRTFTLSPGTYTYTGRAYRPGWRTVTFEAWTNGQHLSRSISYYVYP